MDSIPSTYNGKHLRHVWTYLNAESDTIGHVARFDDDTGKEVVPFFKQNGEGWKAGGADTPRPLFGIDILAKVEPSCPVFVVEGEKAAAALQSLGVVAITSPGGSKAASRCDWSLLNGRTSVYLLPDNDEPGEGYAKDVAAILAALEKPPAVSVVRLPNLPPAGDVVDWLKAILSDASIDWDELAPVPNALNLREKISKTATKNAEPVPDEWIKPSASQWPQPIDLSTAELPEWPEVLPEAAQGFATALSRSTETPPELAGLMVLSILSAAAQGKFHVRLKDDYIEPVNIWACVALPPGSRKTAVQSAAAAPLTQWEREQHEQLKDEVLRAESELLTEQDFISQLRKQASKAKGEEYHALKMELADLEANLPEVPTIPRVWTQDVTPEKLSALMEENEERMTLLSDEAGIFDTLAGRYSSGVPNLDLFLQAHAGSSVRVDRGSRASVFLRSPALTLGLSPQPEALRGLADKPGFRGRGLLARFIYALPPSNLGHRSLEGQPVPDAIKDKYHLLVATLLDMPAVVDDGEQKAHVLKLCPEALEAWHRFALTVEVGMCEGGIFEHITDWAGKLPGAVARIGALFHIARHANLRPWELEISAEDIEAAITMADALSAHALAVFDLIGADPALDTARTVLRWVKRKGLQKFTFRDCHYAHKSRYKRAADLEPGIDVLIERNYIRQRTEKVPHRPSRIYEVNPTIFMQ